MSEEEKLEEVSTPSATETNDTTTETTAPDIVQKDNEVNRRSIKDTLRAAIDEHKREPSKARQAVATQRSRAEDGKFAPEEKDKEPAKVEQRSAPEAPLNSTTEAKPVEPAVASKPAVEPPTSWSPEAKTGWASLPPAIQQAVAKREKEAADGFAQYKAKTEDIDRAFGPQRDTQLQQLGKSRGEAINQLFHWHDALANPQTRVQAFRALAQSHGIDLSTLAPQTGQVQQQSPTDPNFDIQQLLQSQLQAHLQPVLQRVGSFEQQLQQERLAKAQSELASFSQDKPHFEKVRATMGQMIQAGVAQTLEDAYQKATWADPEIRSDILAQEQAKRDTEAKAAQEAAQAKAAQAEEDRKRKEAEAAAKARRANISVRSSSAAGMPNAVTNKLGKSVRESLADTLRDVRAS